MSGGFTIIETLIVLAVTAGMFLAASGIVTHIQAETEFQQAINNTQSEVEQIINQVAAGSFLTSNNFSCSDQGTGVPVITAGATAEGTSNGCILLGKVVQFDTQSNANAQVFTVYPIAGLRNNNDNLTTAAPVAIAPGANTNNTPGFPDASTTTSLQYGITATSMDYLSGGSCSTATAVGAVGFVDTLSSYSNAGQVLSGSREIDLYPISGTSLGETSSTAVDQINDYEGDVNSGLVNSPQDPCGGLQICFSSGTTDQSGLLTIGGNGGNVDSVTTKIYSGKSCA
jgi:type II secretory pathway pseudopilin PulG